MADIGGLITEEDLAAYEAKEREPIRGNYRGYDIVSMPPPSSGGVGIVQMLNILEGFDLAAMGHTPADYLHVLTESMRRAYSDRAEHLGDPDFNEAMPLDRLLDKGYASELRASIDMTQNQRATLSCLLRLASRKKPRIFCGRQRRQYGEPDLHTGIWLWFRHHCCGWRIFTEQ